jgi:O-antigen/teichoic acid export membrane protein
MILILYGEQFTPAIPLLSRLGWSLIPYTISSFISYDLITRGQENMLVQATAISLVIFLALYLWLISAYGLNGGIYAALVGEIIQTIILILFRSNSMVE